MRKIEKKVNMILFFNFLRYTLYNRDNDNNSRSSFPSKSLSPILAKLSSPSMPFNRTTVNGIP